MFFTKKNYGFSNEMKTLKKELKNKIKFFFLFSLFFFEGRKNKGAFISFEQGKLAPPSPSLEGIMEGQ